MKECVLSSSGGGSRKNTTKITSDINTTSKTIKIASNHQNKASNINEMGSERKLLRSSREMRNLAEKMRRDRMSNSINELSEIVPMCVGANKRLDKTSTLRLAANFLCIDRLLKEGNEKEEKGTPIYKGNVVNSLAEAVGGFLLVVTNTGKIVYITEAIEQFLGHTQFDLLGQNIYTVVHPDDQDILKQNLIPKGGGSRVSFFCRMMERSLTRTDPGRYEILHVVGQWKPVPPPPAPLPPTDCEDSDHSDWDHNSTSAPGSRIGTHILTTFVRVVKDRPITQLSIIESSLDEYITRHGLSGNILYTDHRISSVIGLMPTEVIGKSAFSFMHPDDRVWSIVAQKLMFTSTQGQGSVSYRLRCCDGTHVTLRSRGFLEVDKQTGNVESFVCINTVISSQEAEEEIMTQKRKLLPVITSKECEDHLKTISNSLPPELVKEVMPLLTPQAMKSLAATFTSSDAGTSRMNECRSDSAHAHTDHAHEYKKLRTSPSTAQDFKTVVTSKFSFRRKDSGLTPPPPLPQSPHHHHHHAQYSSHTHYLVPASHYSTYVHASTNDETAAARKSEEDLSRAENCRSDQINYSAHNTLNTGDTGAKSTPCSDSNVLLGRKYGSVCGEKEFVKTEEFFDFRDSRFKEEGECVDDCTAATTYTTAATIYTTAATYTTATDTTPPPPLFHDQYL